MRYSIIKGRKGNILAEEEGSDRLSHVYTTDEIEHKEHLDYQRLLDSAPTIGDVYL